MKQKKTVSCRLISTVCCILTMILLFVPLHTQAANNTLVYGDEHTLTRAEWLHDLTILFDMQLKEEDYPDNYYPDLSEQTAYYDDIMIAVENGLVNVEAGKELQPEQPADREFAVSTLNYCLGFISDQGEISFSDVDSVEDPNAAQTALNRNWMQLKDGKFAPDEALTDTEIKAMCKDAQELIAGTEIDEDYENHYTFADGVVEVPKETAVEVGETGTVTIHDSSVKISEGTVFAIYRNDIPVTYTAKSVTQTGDSVVIQAEETDQGISEMDAQGNVEADAVDFIPAEGVEYSIYEEDESGNITAKGKKDVKSKKTIHFSQVPVPGTGEKVKVSIDVTNVWFHYNIDTKASRAMFSVSADVKSTVNLSLKKEFTCPLGTLDAGIGKATVSAFIKVDGSITITFSTGYEFGVQYSNSDFRIIQDFTNTAPMSTTADATLDIGVKFEAKLTKAIPGLKAGAEATVGIRNNVHADIYDDDKLPKSCVHELSYLYANAKAEASVDFGLVKKELGNWKMDVFDESNSPSRFAVHIEDGKLVTPCTRNPDAYYYSKYDSRYGSYGAYGFDAECQIVPVYTYTLDDDGNATITGYTGRATVLNIPSEVDGHTVVAIGENAFKARKDLVYVTIPDTVTIINKNAFNGCTSLSSVQLSTKLVTIQESAFNGCSSLMEIDVPDSVETIGNSAFAKCLRLIRAKLPNNKKYTYVGNNLFEGDTNLSEAILSDYITEIKEKAFYQCGFFSLKLSDNITSIGEEAYYGCNKLTKLELPKYFETFGGSCFGDCDGLVSVQLPKYLSKEEDFHYFVDGSSQRGMFYGCDKLKTVLFEKGITRIPSNLLNGCTGIEEITIPDTVTVIGSHAFNRCNALTKINLPSSLTKIEVMAFRGCHALEKIDIPESVTEIDSLAFISSGLKEVQLPSKLKILGTHAFTDCQMLESVEIPKNIEEIKFYYDGGPTYTTDGPFTECPKLKTISVNYGIVKIPSRLFQNCNSVEEISIPSSVKEIGSKAFLGDSKLEKIELSSSLTNIEGEVFKNCTSLEKIVIPDSVSSMGNNVFEGCSLLSDVTLPRFRFNITSGMFKNCTSLKSIQFPDTLQYIQANAFEGCSNLERITVPDGFKGIEEYAFKDCKRLSSVEIKGNYIAEYAFENCMELTEIKMSDSIYGIGKGAFKSCKSLEEIHLSTALGEISSNLFEECTFLNNIVIPYAVGKIGDEAFKNCTKLKVITIPKGTSTISNNAFSYPDEITIYGVKGSYAEEYASANNMAFETLSSNAEKITLLKEEYTINVNSSAKIPISVIPESFMDDVIWSVSDETIATVSETGTVKGKKEGFCTVTIEIGTLKKECNIIVKNSINSLKLQGKQKVKSGTTTTITCVDGNENEISPDQLIWWSYDTNIISVNQDGTIQAVSLGQTNVEVWLKENTDKKASLSIEVTNEEESSEGDGSEGVKVTISKANTESVTIIGSVSGIQGATPEYAIVEKGQEPGADTAWQTDPVFTGLKAATSYMVYGRIAAKEGSEAGAVSEGLEVTTAAVIENALPGDLDQSGTVKMMDVLMLRKYIVGGYGIVLDENVADVDKNGKVNMMDLILLRKYVVGGYDVELK